MILVIIPKQLNLYFLLADYYKCSLPKRAIENAIQLSS